MITIAFITVLCDFPINFYINLVQISLPRVSKTDIGYFRLFPWNYPFKHLRHEYCFYLWPCVIREDKVRIHWPTPCENVSSGICGQRRLRSACASSQADQGLHCRLTKSLDTTKCINGEQGPDDTLHMRRMILICRFSQVRRHCFAWHGSRW